MRCVMYVCSTVIYGKFIFVSLSCRPERGSLCEPKNSIFSSICNDFSLKPFILWWFCSGSLSLSTKNMHGRKILYFFFHFFWNLLDVRVKHFVRHVLFWIHFLQLPNCNLGFEISWNLKAYVCHNRSLQLNCLIKWIFNIGANLDDVCSHYI